MTKREKVRQIYLNMPYLVNDDMGTLIYIMKRHGMDLTEDQEQAFRRMGNPEPLVGRKQRQRLVVLQRHLNLLGSPRNVGAPKYV